MTKDVIITKKPRLDLHFSIEDELLMWKARWYISKDIDLKNMILQNNDNSNIAGHFGIYKTVQRVKHNYYWHKMEDDVKDCMTM